MAAPVSFLRRQWRLLFDTQLFAEHAQDLACKLLQLHDDTALVFRQVAQDVFVLNAHAEELHAAFARAGDSFFKFLAVVGVTVGEHDDDLAGLVLGGEGLDCEGDTLCINARLVLSVLCTVGCECERKYAYNTERN